MKEDINDCKNIISEIYTALNTLSLTTYSQQKTNVNCMDALKQLYQRLEHIEKEFLDKNEKKV